MTQAQKRRALITRPEPDASKLSGELAQEGFEPITAPLMTVHFDADPPPDDLAGRAPVFTSANGVRGFLALDDATKNIVSRETAFAVGAATATAAKGAGFKKVFEAEGDVTSLARLIQREAAPGEKLLHFAGTHVAGDLAAHLQPNGFNVRRWRVYTAAARTQLPDDAAQFLAGPAGVVLSYSPRTMRLFAELVIKAGLQDKASIHAALCLSAAVSTEARALPWREIVTATSPRNSALLAQLRSII